MTEVELPRAVAKTGSLASSASDVYVAVDARRVALVAGVLAALYIGAVFCVTRVPDGVLALVGVPGGAFARDGGLRMTWSPPPELDPRTLDRMFAAREHGAAIERTADGYVLQVPGVSPDAIDATAQRIGGSGRLEFHAVLQVPEMGELARLLELPMKDQPIDLEFDSWRTEQGIRQDDYFLRAPTRDALAAKLAEAEQRGWKLPTGARIAFEHLRGPRSSGWRTYVIADDAALDGSAIADARGTIDPNTDRPIVLMDLDREGAEVFGDLTGRIAGHKLAIMLDGEVLSAPIINTAIRGGRASITMGGTDAAEQERERDDLVHTLRAGSLPRGGRVVAATYVPGGETAVKRWLGRLIVAIGGGLVTALLAWLAVRLVRPHRRRDRALTGPRSIVTPIAWTLLGVVVLVVGSSLMLPGVNEVQLDWILGGSRRHHHFLDTATTSIFALGIMPVISSAVIVEIVISIVPRWRRLRDGNLDARRRVGLAVALATIALAGVQACFVTDYLRALASSSVAVVAPGRWTQWVDIATMIGGTLCLAWVASLITRRGLGNGFAVLIVAGWLMRASDQLLDLDAAHIAVVALGIACIAMVVLAATRWRVRGPRTVAIPLPAAGVVPLSSGGGIAALVGLLGTLGLVELPVRAARWLDPLQLDTVAVIAIVVASFVWSLAFARPGRRARELAHVDLLPPSRETWLRATAATALLLVTIYAIARAGMQDLPVKLLEPIEVAIAIATIADLVSDARARRRELAPAWQLHDPLLADVVRDRLTAAGIDHHLQASRLRTLLSPLGAYVPITVLVLPAQVADAERVVRALVE